MRELDTFTPVFTIGPLSVGGGGGGGGTTVALKLTEAETPAPAAAIGAAASSAGVEDPRGPLTRRTLRKLKRKHAARGRGQVEGLKREDAVAAAKLAGNEGTALGLRDAALLLLGSDCLLRISEAPSRPRRLSE